MFKRLILFFIIFTLSINLIPFVEANEYKISVDAVWDGLSYAGGRKEVRSSNGTLYVIADNAAANMGIFRSVDNGSTWVRWKELTGVMSYSGSLGINETNCLFATWSEVTSVKFDLYDNKTDSWLGAVQLSRVGYDSSSPSIILNTSGGAWIAWYSKVASVGYKIVSVNSSDGGHTWSRPMNISKVVDAALNQGTPSWSLNPVDDNLTCWWDGIHAASGGTYQIRFRRYCEANQTWSNNVANITATAANELYPTVIRTTDGVYHVVWQANAAASIGYSRYFPTNGSIVSISIHVSANSKWPSISRDYQDNIYVVFNVGNPIYCRSRIDDVWGTAYKTSRDADIQQDAIALYAEYPTKAGIPINIPYRGVSYVYTNNSDAQYYYKTENVTWLEPIHSTWFGLFARSRAIYFNNTRKGMVINITVYKYAGNTSNKYHAVSLDGYCEPNFRDIRFLSNNNLTQLPYYQESDTLQWDNHTTFWVNNSANDSRIWIYWGNPTATSNSSGAKTFLTYVNSTNWWNRTSVPGHIADISMQNFHNGTHMYMRNDMVDRTLGFDISRNITLGEHRGGLNDETLTDNFTLIVNTQYGQPAGSGLCLEFCLQNSLLGNQRLAQVRTTIDVATPNYRIVSSSAGAGRFLCNMTGYNFPITVPGTITKNWRYVVEVNNRSRIVNYTVYNNTQKLIRPVIVGTPRSLAFPDNSPWMARYLILDEQGLVVGTQRATNVNFTGDIYIIPKWYINPPKIAGYGPIIAIPDAVYPVNASHVEETTATLAGYMIRNISFPSKCGFYVHTSLPTKTTYTYNVTSTTNYTCLARPGFTYALSGLTPGEYYYVRTWYKNASGWNISEEIQYFLTKPYAPTFFRMAGSGAGWVKFEWINPTIGGGTNLFTLIRYNRTSLVTNYSLGTLGCNSSGQISGHSGSATVYGLAPGVEYYFTAFSFVNASGSPVLHHYSDSYAWVVGNSTGGLYNISIKYENLTYRGTDGMIFNQFINLTKYGDDWELDIVYGNRTEVNFLTTGQWQSNISSHNWYKGFLRLNLSFAPIFMVLKFNLSNISAAHQCSRTQVIVYPTVNYTFYMFTNKSVYGITTDVPSDILIPYTLSFVDKTQVFENSPPNNVYIQIYAYDNNRTKQIIHSEFWDATHQVYPWLLYKKTYYIGYYCSKMAISNGGLVPTGITTVGDITSPNPLIISYQTEMVYLDPNVWYSVRANWMPVPSGMYVSFIDYATAVNEVTLKIFDFDNETLTDVNTTNTTICNFTYTGAMFNHRYIWQLTFNSSYESLTLTYYGYLAYNISKNVTSYTKLNNTFTTIFGITPVRSIEDPTQYVSWVVLIIFGIAFIFLSAFAGFLAEGAVVVVGAWIAGCGVLISNLPGPGNALTIAFGAFLVLLGLLFAYKGGAR